MTAEAALHRHPLGAPLSAGDPGRVELRDVPSRCLVELRLATAEDGSGADTGPASAELRFALPRPGRVGSDGQLSAVGLGPGWWLLDAPEPEEPRPGTDPERALEPPLVHRLRAVGGRLSAVDVSAAYGVLELSGPQATKVLAHGCSIDLHPREFGPGQSARTTLAKAQIVLAQLDDAPTYRIWVRSSFARYLAEWLLDAAVEYLA